MSGTTGTPPDLGQQVLAQLTTLLSQLEGDGILVATGPLLNAVNSIIANGTLLNIVGQTQALLPTLLAAGLGEQATVTTQVFTAIKNIVLLLQQAVPVATASLKASAGQSAAPVGAVAAHP